MTDHSRSSSTDVVSIIPPTSSVPGGAVVVSPTTGNMQQSTMTNNSNFHNRQHGSYKQVKRRRHHRNHHGSPPSPTRAKESPLAVVSPSPPPKSLTKTRSVTPPLSPGEDPTTTSSTASTSHSIASHTNQQQHRIYTGSPPPTPPIESTTTIALDYSANACSCLQSEDLKGALSWYQRALLVYQDAASLTHNESLGIVDTCNAAATLHNMGAVYNALQQGDAALQCYHDAEQLYRECHERLTEGESRNVQTRLTTAELEDQETVCLTALIAETLHHRAQIYETSVWDSVAALECHEACVVLLRDAQAISPKSLSLVVTCVDDVYFQQDLFVDQKLEWLSSSYKALASLYQNSDSPHDALVVLEEWKALLEPRKEERWRKSLSECYQQLTVFYFAEEELSKGIDALHGALELQLEAAPKEAVAAATLSSSLLKQMNVIGWNQEQKGDYDQALVCYEKVLLLVSRYLGEDHWEVAETLVKIGRVMELQGNPAGGLDLYQAAHTIYQAACRQDDAVTTRAAMESVVRIANVLMSQKKWSEAVEFLKELPQAKEWMCALEEEPQDTNHNNTTAMVQSTGGNNTSNNKNHPTSVHQAIVFRELGRAYMGMGELAKAKECLLESARRLEGTDHEEDVFELLMHVEFCQKQERKAATACRRARSRSRSAREERTTARSSAHSRTGSMGSLENTTRITKDAVAAVLSMEDTSNSARAVPLLTSRGRHHQGSPEKSPVSSSPGRNQLAVRSNEGDNDLDMLALPNIDKAPRSPRSPKSPLMLGPPAPMTPPQSQALQEDISCNDSRSSLGSLGTESEAQGKQAACQDNEMTEIATRDMVVVEPEDQFNANQDSFNVQRAKDIILKRVTHDCQGAFPVSSMNEDDDGKSDVVSSVLVGLDIDIDLPPASPSASGSALAGLTVIQSGSMEKPFDEATTSSSRERPFDERSSQGGQRGALIPPPNSGPIPNYAMSIQQQMMSTVQDESKPRSAPEEVAQSMSDLTSAYGQSITTTSLYEGIASPVAAAVPPLLQSSKVSDNGELENPNLLLPPPPPALQSPHPPVEIETKQKKHATKEDDEIHNPMLNPALGAFPTQSLTSEKMLSFGTYPASQSQASEKQNEPMSPVRVTMPEPLEFSPIAKCDQSYHADDDDDASSDPFAGYEDFDIDDDEDEAGSAYGGDSESEQGYNRFAKEDLSSEEENSVSSYLLNQEAIERKKAIMPLSFPVHAAPCDDVRQPSQSPSAQPDIFSSAARESPVPTTHQARAPMLFGSEADVSQMRDASPTFDISERAPPASKETDTTENPAAKRGSSSSRRQGSEGSRGSPGNRIVKALSNSIRRRRQSKENGNFEVVLSEAELEANEEAKEGENIPLPPDLSAIKLSEENALQQEESDTFQGGPIQFVSMASPSFNDDTVSQITFAVDDNHGKYKKSTQWWGQLSLPTEQLEGYIHQAVEAAEGFLSAKAIHAKMKSQPLDLDSEDEEDDDLIVRDPSTLPLATTTGSKVGAGTCSPISNSLLFKSKSINQARTFHDEIKNSPVIVEKDAIAPIAVAPSLFQIDQHVLSSPRSNVEKEIEHQEELLKQYELDALNDDKATPKVASTLFKMAILFLQNENLDKALKSTNEALRHQKFLDDSPNAARSLHLLADVFVRKGEYDSALSCYTEVQELELDLYGYIHEESANTLNRIGSVLARQSKFSMAMDKHQEALRILKECHGEELRHPLVSQTLIHIGAVYYRERNSLATVRNGIDGYSTFIEVGMLEVIGRAHEDRGSYKMAISFFEEKLQCLNQKKKDPKSEEGLANLEDVATTLNSLGMLSCRAGIFMEAIDYYDKALEVQKQIGCDKMHIATARVLTATVQFHLGFFQKALRMLQDALKELQEEAGSDHETVAATWFQIGVVQVALCEYDDGMDALEEALRIQTNLLGMAHPATLRTRREIGNMYAIYESELEAAFCQFNDILTLQRRIHGHKHPNVAETLHSLGCAYARKGDFTTAIKTLEECYYMRTDYLGADHPLQATTLHEIAEIHRKRQRFRKAIHICNAVLEIRKESLSERHIDVARALATKASCLVVTGDYNNAMKCLEEALPMAEQAVGARHPAVADVFVHMGGIHLRKCHFEEAKEWAAKAMDIYQNSNLDEDHPSLKDAVALIERVDRDEMLCV